MRLRCLHTDGACHPWILSCDNDEFVWSMNPFRSRSRCSMIQLCMVVNVRHVLQGSVLQAPICIFHFPYRHMKRGSIAWPECGLHATYFSLQKIKPFSFSAVIKFGLNFTKPPDSDIHAMPAAYLQIFFSNRNPVLHTTIWAHNQQHSLQFNIYQHSQ